MRRALLRGIARFAPLLASALLTGSPTVELQRPGRADAIRFAPGGQVFIAERRGVVKRYDGPADAQPQIVVDIQSRTHALWDRGLIGLALDPGDAAGSPYLYVSNTYDHVLRDPAAPPRWGDPCPSPPGAADSGCVVSGRISRFDPSGAETVLVEDFGQRFPSHSVGDLAFGADGALYASAEEAAFPAG